MSDPQLEALGGTATSTLTGAAAYLKCASSGKVAVASICYTAGSKAGSDFTDTVREPAQAFGQTLTSTDLGASVFSIYENTLMDYGASEMDDWYTMVDWFSGGD